MYDFSYFDCSNPLYFMLTEFIVLFPFLTKYYHILFVIIVFWIVSDRPSGFLFFVPALLLSVLTPLFFPSSSVSLSYSFFLFPFAGVWENTRATCMSSPFPIVILNGTCFFPTVQLQVYNENPVRFTKNTDSVVNLNTKLNYICSVVHSDLYCVFCTESDLWHLHTHAHTNI